MYRETATRFGPRGVVPAMINNAAPKRVLSPERQRVETLIRKCRRNQLDWLIKQHAGDKDYFLSVSAWRREKIDLLLQEI